MPEPVAEPVSEPEPAAASDPGQGRFRAIYTYTASDADEVSFSEGDVIVGAIIAEGWMKGTVESTGLSGLLPSNYVEAL